MANSIDERIVRMQFDNAQFENGVSQTLNTLGKLKNASDGDQLSKGFSKSGDSLSMMASGVEKLTKRFSASGIAGMEVIKRMTNATIDFGKSFAKNTIGGIVEGGKRRAFNIENARFQLQGILKDEKQVKAVMDDAMDSVDQTAYGYDEAAKAASMFAASGLKAGPEMQQALRGIAGVAATTNSDYESMSRIFTQVAGNGRLMGNDLMQLAVRGMNAAATIKDYFNGVNDGSIKASKSVGKAIKDLTGGAKVSEADIREFVSDSSISFDIFSEVMSKTFGDHAKDANKTFEGSLANIRAALSKIGALFYSPLIAENGPFVNLFNAVRIKLNELKDTLGPFADEVTGVIGKLADFAAKVVNGLDVSNTGKVLVNIFTGFKNIAKGLLSLIKPIGTAFKKIFPDGFDLHVGKISEGFKNLTEHFKDLSPIGSVIEKVFIVIFTVLKAGISVLKSIVGHIRDLMKYLEPLKDVAKTVFDHLSSGFDKLKSVIDSGDIKGKLSDISKDMKGAGASAKDFLSNLKESAKNGFPGFVDNVKNKLSNLKEVLIIVKDGIKEFIDGLTNGKGIITSVGDIASSLFGKLKESITNFKFPEIKFDAATTFGKIGNGLLTVINKIKEAFSGFGKVITGAFENIKKIFGTLTGELKGKFTPYEALKSTNALLTGGLVVMLLDFAKTIKKTMSSFGGFGRGFEKVSKSFAGLIDSMSNKETNADKIKKIAIAIGILAASLIALSLVPADKLKNGGIALGSIAGGVTAMAAALSHFNKGGIDVKGFLPFAAGMALLGIALSSIAKVGDPKQILAATAALSTLILVVGTLSKYGGKLNALPSGLVGLGLGMVGLALALRLIIKPIQILGKMPWKQLVQGGAAIVVMLAGIGLAMKLMPPTLPLIGAGLLLVAVALIAMTAPILIMSKIKWETVITSMGKLAIGLALLGAGLFVMQGAIPGAVALAIAVPALVALAGALMLFDKLNGQITAGTILSITGTLVGLGVGLTALTFGLVGALMLPMVARGMLMLLPVLLAFTKLPMGKIAISMLKFVGALSILALAAPIIIIASASLAAFGVSIAAIGVGLIASGAGFAAFAVSAVAGATAFVVAAEIIIASLPLLISGIGNALISLNLMIVSLGPSLTQAIVTIGGVIFNSIISLAPLASQAVVAVITAILNAIITTAPLFGQTVVTIGSTILSSIGVLIPQFIQTVVTIGQAILTAINTLFPQVVATVGTCLVTLIQGLALYVPQMATAALQLIAGFLEGLAAGIPMVIQAAFDLAISLINGLADGIRNNNGEVIAAVDNLMDAVIGAIGEWLSHVWEKGKEIVGKLVDGFGEKKQAAKDKMKEIVEAVIQKIKDKIGDVWDAGVDFAMGFINGIGSKIEAAARKAAELARSAWHAVTGFLNEHSPSRLLMQAGVYFSEGFANGIIALKDKVADSATSIGEAAAGAMERNVRSTLVSTADALDSYSKMQNRYLTARANTTGSIIAGTLAQALGLSNALSGDDTWRPTIAPVLDLSNVQNGEGIIGGLFNSGYGINLNPSLGHIFTPNELNGIVALSGEASGAGLLAAVMSLRDDVRSLGGQVSRMQVVLDTGVIAGAISEDVDRNIGESVGRRAAIWR